MDYFKYKDVEINLIFFLTSISLTCHLIFHIRRQISNRIIIIINLILLCMFTCYQVSSDKDALRISELYNKSGGNPAEVHLIMGNNRYGSVAQLKHLIEVVNITNRIYILGNNFIFSIRH